MIFIIFSGTQSMEHIDFHISYRCVNKCIFCSSSDSIRKFKNHPLRYEQAIAILKEKRKQFKSVNFTGGEPTLLSFLPRLAQESKKLGYKIYVGTNGTGFADRDFCRKVAPFIDEICFSVHGYTSALHNFHTKNKASFANLNKALKNISAFPVTLLSNTVITKYNFPYLEEILSFLASKKIKQSLFSNLAPEGRGLDNYKKLATRLSDIKKRVPRLVKSANNDKIILRFFGIPACVLGDYATHSNDFFWDARLNIEQAGDNKKFFIEQEKTYFPNRSRIKTQKCKACFYKNICGGVFQAYYNIFKDKELQPLKK